MDPEQPPKSSFDFRKSIPYVILFAMLLVLLLSSALSKRPPEIQSISPEIAPPGEELLIQGRFFGEERNGGRVMIGSYAPPSSSYLDWGDSQISLLVPEDMEAGLVTVVTRHGESREVLAFTNEAILPRVLSGPRNPGQPYIAGYDPKSGPPGTTITITGTNFGLEQGDSEVRFAWVAGEGASLGAGEANILSASHRDFDYVAWHDREVRVRVPDGASSGNLSVVTDKGESNSVYFEVNDAVGSKVFSSRRIYHVEYGISVGDIGLRENGEEAHLRLWLPNLAETPRQREVKLISREPEPLFEDYEGFALFSIEDPLEGTEYDIRQSFMLAVFDVETKINVRRVRISYDTDSRLYQTYTSANEIVPAGDDLVVRVARSVVGGEQNPYEKARLLYNYLVGRLEYDAEAAEVVEALNSRRGGARVYALLYTALLRAVGVPARPVSGYVVPASGTPIRHAWAEYYLEDFGWVPVDPVFGDRVRYGAFPSQVNPGNYYFGNVDNQRVTISRGLAELRRMDSKASLVTRDDTVSFQSLHEEASGVLQSYTAVWEDLEVLGIY